jgi:tripeptide aminopeptidase
MNINRDRMIAEFVSLVSIDSPSYQERQMGDYITKRLNSLGLRVFEDDAAGSLGGSCGNIYGFLNGTVNAPPLLFDVHMDTVEPSRGKQAVLHEDGRITSRGDTVLGADDLSGIAAILEALTVIREQNLPHRPIEVLFTAAEEVYCEGIRRFDFSLLKARQAYVLDLTGPVGTAAYKAPAIVKFRATVQGVSAHAGFAPEKGVHAIQTASAAISALPMGRVDEETTLNVGIIEGGLATNIVPALCTVRGEVRSYAQEKADRLIGFVKDRFSEAGENAGAAITFSAELVSSAYETPLKHPVAKLFEKACRKLSLPCGFVKTFGGSDHNILSQHNITGLVLATAMNQVHSCQEYTSQEELGRIAQLVLTLMTLDPDHD